MKLLTITIDALPMHGGIARYTDTMCRLFGDSMHVVADLSATVGNDQEPQDAPYTLAYMSFMQERWPQWMGAVRYLQSQEVDAVFTHHVLPLGVACLMNKRRTATPYVVVLHGMDFELATRNMWKRWLTKQVLREARDVIVNSQSLQARVERFANRSVTLVYPPAYIQPAPRTAHKGIQLLSVARLVERKGIQRVLQALATDFATRSDWHYTVVGEGKYAEQIKTLISNLDLSKHVTLVEDPTQDQIQSAYQAADVFVLPTITKPGDKEGFGMVYIEAGQFGIPSIASRTTGVDEAVIDGTTGILVDSDTQLTQAIAQLMDDTALRAELGAAAKAHAKRINASLPDYVAGFRL